MVTGIIAGGGDKTWNGVFLSELLLENGSTNQDATGMANVRGVSYKTPQAASRVVYTAPYNRVLRDIIDAPLIAHVRVATSGKKALDQAHPFNVGQVWACHNGHIRNYKELIVAESLPVTDPDPVDSIVIPHLLAKYGLTQEGITKTTGLLEGSYTFLAFEEGVDSIWAVVGANPLHYISVGGVHVLNTSKINVLFAAHHTNGLRAVLTGDELSLDYTEQPLTEYNVYRLTSDGLIAAFDIPKPAKPAVLPVTLGPRVRVSVSLDEICTKSDVMVEMLNIPFISRGDVEWACQLAGGHWSGLSIGQLEAIRDTLAELSVQYGTAEKQEMWEARGGSYKNVGPDFEFPYFLNDLNIEEACNDAPIQ